MQTLLRVLEGAELWAVVKATAGYGAADCGAAALDAGATALCVASVGEALQLRGRLPLARLIVLGPCSPEERAGARGGPRTRRRRRRDPERRARAPEARHRHGPLGDVELLAPTRDVVGVMTHLATADSDVEFARVQLDRFREATASLAGVTRHVANSAAALRLPEARLDAARCGIALYGLSPFGADPADDGLEPVLSWRSEITLAKLLQAGESTGYGRRFVAAHDTWIGVVPVGYADGLRRDLSGTELLVDGERRRIVGTVSMDAVTIELDHEVPAGTPVTIVGDGLLLEEHARLAGTITYELACGIDPAPERTRREVVDS